MAQDIKNKITLTGEKEYNAALKEAQRHLKTLRSELKAETAELGKNASEQEKSRIKGKNLQKQIQEQEKVVKTLKEALEKAKEEYKDNEEVITKWELKLNEARTSLANMRNDLQTTNKITAEGVTATKNFADAISAIGNAGGNIASSIESAFTGVIGVVKDALSDLWGMVAETAARANEWTDIAAMWNTKPEIIEKYARGVKSAGKNFSDLASAVSKISSSDADKIFELTHTRMLGDGDEWDYAMRVLNAISGMTNYSQKLETLQEIFGDKRASGILDILNAWDTIASEGDRLTEGGYGLGADALETMATIQERINGIEASWEALKDNIAGQLGTATLPILMDVQGGLDGIAEYLNATDDAGREAAKAKIEENIKSFCKDVAKAIKDGLEIIGQVGSDLQQGDSVIEKAIGSALIALKQTLEWLMDDKNWTTIKLALEGFFGLWLAGRGAQALAAIAALAANIKTISAFKSLEAIKGLLSGGGGSNTVTTGTGGGLFSGLHLWATQAAAGAANIFGSIGNGLGPVTDWFTHNTDVGRFLIGQETWEDVQKAASDYADSVKKNAETFQDDWANNPIVKFWGEGIQTRSQNARQVWDMIFGGKKLPEAVAEVIEDELLDDDTGLLLSPRDRQAVEDYWDAIRDDDGEGTDAANAYLKLWEHFSGSADDLAVFEKITEMIDGLKEFGSLDADLPSWWFSELPNNGGDGGLTSEDISGFNGLPGQISAAARAGTAQGISGIRVYMDGVAVGHLVAPTVSRDIASWTV